MFRLVGILLITLAVLGLVTFVWALFYYRSSTRNGDHKRRLIIQSACTFWSCTLGFVFLMFRVAGPLEVALVVAMALCAGYGAAFINPKFFTRP